MDQKVTIQGLGQLMKTKYPGSYDNVDDTELGNLVIQKHPEYQNMITTGRGGGMVEAIGKPFMKVGASGLAIAEKGLELAGRAVGAEGFANRRKEDLEMLSKGVDMGQFGTVKPLGYQMADENMGKGEAVLKSAADIAGTGLEIASYGMEPLKAGRGFFGAIRSALPIAATVGAGKSLQKGAEGADATTALLEGGGEGLGVLAGMGLMRGAGNLFANWGARAVKSEAVRAVGGVMREMAEKVYGAMPEAFQKNVAKTVDELAQSSPALRRTIAVLKNDFESNWKVASDAAIDSLMPSVKDPDLAFGTFQRTLSEEMGNNFRLSNKLYDDAKASQTMVTGWEAVTEKLAKTAQNIEKSLMGSYGRGTKTGGTETVYASLKNLEQRLKDPRGLSLKEIMVEWESLMQQLPTSDKESAAAARDIASALYANARTQLQKTDPALLNQWDLAYQSWKKAGDLYESGPLNMFKSSGDVDTVVDKMISKELTRPETTALRKAMQGEGGQQAQDLLVNSVLRKAKDSQTTAEGAKIVKGFLDNYEELLRPEQAKFLDDIGSFMEGNFDEFVNGMRGKLSGGAEAAIPEGKAGELLKEKARIDVMTLADEGKFDEIAERFVKFVDESPKDAVERMKLYTPEEKQAIGASIVQDLMKPETPLASLNPDGTYSLDKSTVQSVLSTWEKLKTMPKGVADELFSPEQIKGLSDAVKEAQKYDDLSNVEFSAVKRFLHGAVSFFYAMKGWAPGAFKNAAEAFGSEGTKVSKYYKEVDELIERGILQKNKRIQMGDLMKILSKPVGIGTGQGVDAAIGE